MRVDTVRHITLYSCVLPIAQLSRKIGCDMRRRSSWDDEGQASPSWQPQHSWAAATVPIGLASSMLTLALGAFLAGMFCAPTMTASVDAVARVVPERVRGEAMGWHGSFLTTGGALGGPIAGWAIDRHGFAGGFAAVGGLGALICVAGVLIVGGRRAQRSRSARRASA